MAISSLLQLLLPLLSSILGSEGVIPDNLKNLVTSLATAIPTLISGLFSGTPQDKTLATLKAIMDEVNALKTSGTLFTLNQANIINAIGGGISDAIVGYEKSLLVDDPSNLTQLPENL